MARVLFIKTRMPVMDRFFTAVSPPLGPICLAAFARQERPGQDEFLLIDERLDQPSDAALEQTIRQFRPDVVGLSVLTSESKRLDDLVPLVRRSAPGCKLLIGGPHATAEGEHVLEQFPDSYVMRGDSELPFVQILDCFDRGELYPKAKLSGLMYRHPHGGDYAVGYNVETAEQERLPTPAWDLVDFGSYQKLPRMTPTNVGDRYAPLFTSRGCPYRCIYCHDVFQKGFRAWDANRVVDEIEYLIDNHGVHDFEIYDDIFNADYKRALAICNEIKRRGLKTAFTFPNGIRGDRMTPELLSALADVGTYHMAFAVESASPRIQKLIKKHNNTERLAANIETAARHGIFCWGFFMLGFPTETRAEMQSTVDFAVASALHGAFFFQVIPFGGTELSDEYYGGQTLATGDGDYHYTDSSLAAEPPEVVREMQWKAYLRFYYDPRRAVRTALVWPLPMHKLTSRGVGFTKNVVMARGIAALRDALTTGSDGQPRWGSSSKGLFRREQERAPEIVRAA